MKSPLLTPADSIEVVELLEETAALLRNTGKFAALRKDIRMQLEEKARECESIAIRIRKTESFDESLLNGMDSLSAKSGISFQKLMADAMEAYISDANRKRA